MFRVQVVHGVVSSSRRREPSRAAAVLAIPSRVPLRYFLWVPPQPHPPPPPRSSRPDRALPRPESAICGPLELLLRPNIKLLPPAIPRRIRGLGKHPHSLLYPPQQTPFHFFAGADLPASSRGGNNGRSWPTIFHPFPRAPSHLNGTSSLSSLSPCPRLREWRPGAPFPWSSMSSCSL
jgi:hypothetical protein